MQGNPLHQPRDTRKMRIHRAQHWGMHDQREEVLPMRGLTLCLVTAMPRIQERSSKSIEARPHAGRRQDNRGQDTNRIHLGGHRMQERRIDLIHLLYFKGVTWIGGTFLFLQVLARNQAGRDSLSFQFIAGKVFAREAYFRNVHPCVTRNPTVPRRI